MERSSASNRRFDSISPSAKWLILMKGQTTIPFARKTAELVEYPVKFTPDFHKKDLGFWGRTLHFESRYWAIDQLLSEIPIKNVLELSAGYSFRGLDLAQRKEVFYVDTDLPDMIARKSELIKAIGGETGMKGHLELAPLNALDEKMFHDTVARFPPGELVIVNEGLLVYLDTSEKEKLCEIIRTELQARGGYWITGDIYIKLAGRRVDLGLDEKTKKFFEEHHVEENRFESFEAAKEFFRSMGFLIDKEANVDPTTLVAFPYLIKSATQEELLRLRAAGKIHATWRLRLAGS